MQILWHGNTCFSFKDKKATIVVNPDKEAGELKADAVFSGLGKDTAPVQDTYKVFDWPGEYEVKGIPIVGLQVWTKSKSKEDEEGVKGSETLAFYFEMNGVKICHLGTIGHVLTSEALKTIGDVDILLIDGTIEGNLGVKKATEILENIDPKAVVFMGKGDQKDFMKELGAEGVQEQEIYEIDSLSQLPPDKRCYVLLKKS